MHVKAWILSVCVDGAWYQQSQGYNYEENGLMSREWVALPTNRPMTLCFCIVYILRDSVHSTAALSNAASAHRGEIGGAALQSSRLS